MALAAPKQSAHPNLPALLCRAAQTARMRLPFGPEFQSMAMRQFRLDDLLLRVALAWHAQMILIHAKQRFESRCSFFTAFSRQT
jgi:hypothetical protein